MSQPLTFFHGKRDHHNVRSLVPFITLVLGLTAIPVELRRFDLATLSLSGNASDVVANLVLYLPLAMVLVKPEIWRVATIATSVSLFAEASQFFMVHRYPSPIDLALNVAGATIGLLISCRCRINVPSLTLNIRAAWLSLLMAAVVLTALVSRGFGAWSIGTVLSVNCRGATFPGSLEAYWAFDNVVAGVLGDSSGNELTGELVGGEALADGIHGLSVRSDGKTNYADFGHPVELRLMGSMTASAWIRSTSFPVDDAAIVSTNGPRYPLDTTVDRGPRTIGFKIVDPCGDGMARYGATKLDCDVWYHVAGVYDAYARALHVYLNGRLDDGFLLGPVGPVQQASNHHVLVGKRPDLKGFEFSGQIDDVRIYSRALLQEEIETDMNSVTIGKHTAGKPVYSLAGEILKKRWHGPVVPCPQPARDEDSPVPGAVVAAGMLVALACASFWPGHRLAIVAASVAVAVPLVPIAAI
jgi:hypothetical protein